MAEMTAKGVAALVVLYLAWGSTYFFNTVLLRAFPPFLVSSVRHGAAGLVLVSVALTTDPRTRRKPFPAELRGCLIVSVCLFVCGNGGVVLSQSMGLPGGIAATLVSSMPAIVIVMQWVVPFFGGSRPQLGVASGLALGLLGVLFIFSPWTSASVPVLPCLLCLLACTLWGFGTLLAKKEQMPPNALMSTGIQALFGAYIMHIVGALRGEYNLVQWDLADGQVVFAYFYMVFVGSCLGYTCFSWLTQNAPIHILVTYCYVNPVVALVLDWIFLQKLPAPLAFLGCICIVVGVFLTTYFKYRKITEPAKGVTVIVVTPPPQPPPVELEGSQLLPESIERSDSASATLVRQPTFKWV